MDLTNWRKSLQKYLSLTEVPSIYGKTKKSTKYIILVNCKPKNGVVCRHWKLSLLAVSKKFHPRIIRDFNIEKTENCPCSIKAQWHPTTHCNIFELPEYEVEEWKLIRGGEKEAKR